MSGKRGSSPAEMLQLPDHLDTPAFTCEVCKISVRSAQKLMDHVNFSPLHQASLGLGKSRAPERAKSMHLRRLLYDGSKLFWRVNETLDLCIYEDKSINCVTIRAFTHTSQQADNSPSKNPGDSIPPLELDLRRLRQTLGLDTTPRVQAFQGKMMMNLYRPAGMTPSMKTKAAIESLTPDNSAELITKFLLGRLQAARDPRDRINLTLQKLNDDEVDPIDLLLQTSSASKPMPTDLAVRRRHTIDDVKDAQKEVSVAATRLKNARIKAEELSNLARLTLDAFSREYGSNSPDETRMIARTQADVAALASSASNTILGLAGSRRHSIMPNKPASAWFRAYDRVVLQNAVERSKGVLHELPQFHEQESVGLIEH